MMNGTAVLPAVVTTFAGNAATISAGSVQNGSAIGTAGGFSDTLGAMVTSGQQCIIIFLYISSTVLAMNI